MRVISGSLKGRKIVGYDIEGTRPTMDRVKESVFGSIQDYVRDSVVLDLFAGSGNLGIEALSNGSSYCYFVDNNKLCVRCIKDNIKCFGLGSKCSVLCSDYISGLKYFYDNGISFDIIFIDPPYRYCVANEVVDMIMKYGLLRCEGVIILEYKDDVISEKDGLKIIKNKKYGDKFICIYKKTID